jgi:ABC-type transport system involved in Fe-S cluster assembly fused permease/ATPase subunit
MKFSQWFKDQIIKRETNKLRKELKLAIDKNINDDQYSIDNFTKIYEDFKKHNYSKHDSFLNLCIFSDVVSIDLTILVEKYRFAERKQEKKLFARVMSIVDMQI